MDIEGGQEQEGEMYGESNMENRQPMGICYMTQATQTGAL